jgi:hypothetical protein
MYSHVLKSSFILSKCVRRRFYATTIDQPFLLIERFGDVSEGSTLYLIMILHVICSGIVVLRMNRPETKNAINRAMLISVCDTFFVVFFTFYSFAMQLIKSNLISKYVSSLSKAMYMAHFAVVCVHFLLSDQQCSVVLL